ncbi:YrzQ family protein [Metabacillus malikii]|uniref:DUF3918 domain-containing protein n=1 Tax=Metabacillus malikii TaxID=1504265 RepID=A0ABT9ZGW9_9BACI|nr:YrzQ family protein [Metabacillus malikii]MDQ0231538.1 hypothetical protein [Metabacillus malikii]
MKRTVTSLLSIGLGAAAYHFARNSNLQSNRSMKNMKKRVMKML